MPYFTQPEADAATAAGVVFADGVARGGVYTSPRISAWHRKIDEEITDTAVLVVGDSTGAENATPRWVRGLAAQIAAQWPRQTVVYRPWDDTTKAYLSPVTISTGVSGRTITVYNCSVSGQTIGYALNNITTITSGIVEPDVIITNYGHNSPQDLDNYRGLQHQGVNAYASRYPNAAVVVTAQNPRATITTGVTLASDYAPDQLRQRANYEYAMAEGHVCADVNAVYRAYGDYNADLLVDGLHPGAAGTVIWTATVWKPLKPQANRSQSSTPASRPSRIWIPAKAFDPVDGSPSYAVSFGIGGWLLDPAAEESVSAVVDYPSDWKLVNVEAFFVCPTAPDSANRTVVVQPAFMYVGASPAGTLGSNVIGAWTAAANVSLALPTLAAQTAISSLYTRQGGSQKPLAFRVSRKAADAGDTLAQDVIFLGIMIQRMF